MGKLTRVVLRGERISNDPDLLDSIQAWAEHNYDTRLLHSNLSFVLLKRLAEVGDQIAQKRIKEETINRFISGDSKIQRFLLVEGYLNVLSKEEIFSFIENGDIILNLEQTLKKEFELNTANYPSPRGVVVENGKIVWLSLYKSELTEVPEIVKELKCLKGLSLKSNFLKALPEWITDLSSLEFLLVSYNHIERIPDTIENLVSLKQLDLHNNRITSLPESIGNLIELEILQLNNNIIKELPESIGDLKNVKDFGISNNDLESLPDSIGYMTALRLLNLSKNPIKKLPFTLNDLHNLNGILLKGIKKDAWNFTDYMKKKLFLKE